MHPPRQEDAQIVELEPVDKRGEQVARGASEDVNRQQPRRTHERLSQHSSTGTHVSGQWMIPTCTNMAVTMATLAAHQARLQRVRAKNIS